MYLGRITYFYITNLVTWSLADSCPRQLSLHLDTEEEAKIGKRVGSISQAFTHVAEFNKLELPHADIISQECTNLIGINKAGIITIAGIIDRDSRENCQDKVRCLFDCPITYQLQKPIQNCNVVIINVKLTVIDRNDNSPQFSTSKYSVVVREDDPIGMQYRLPTAKDRDASAENQPIRYELLANGAGGQYFDLVMNDNLPCLQLKREIDFEKVSNLMYKLTAYDAMRKNGSVEIVVNINDVNDNTPQWTNLPYIKKISECNQQPFIVVKATDGDVSDRVTYSVGDRQLIKKVNVSGSFYFRFSDNTLKVEGQFKTTAITGELHVPIVAKDSASHINQTMVKFIIRDCNNHKPDITVMNLNKTFSIPSVAEHSPAEKTLAIVTVRDADYVSIGRISCSLDNSTLLHLELVKGSIGMKTLYNLKTRRGMEFDREQVKHGVYTTAVRCVDSAEDQRQEAWVKLNVKVLDKNDQTPVFVYRGGRVDYFFKIVENAPSDMYVGSVKAIDNDEGDNARITYEIVGTNRQYFRVDAYGRIRSNIMFDRETVNLYTFEMLAKDRGLPSLTASTSVTVTIADVNDKSPQFSSDHYEFRLVESSGRNRKRIRFGQVNATDLDREANGTVGYQLRSVEGDECGRRNPFRIANNGVLSVYGVLDREKCENWNLNVLAYDGGTPSLTSTSNIIIRVLDINDHSPKFLFPTTNNKTCTMPRTLSLGGAVCSVVANDSDAGENGSVTYHQVYLKNRNVFAVDERTGIITLTEKIPNRLSRFVLMVVAKDGGTPPRSSPTAQLSIIVETVRENNDQLPHNDATDSSDYQGIDDNMKLVLCLTAVIFVVFLVLLFVFVYIYCNGYTMRCCSDVTKTPKPQMEGDGASATVGSHRTNQGETSTRITQSPQRFDSLLGIQRGVTKFNAPPRSPSYGYVAVSMKDGEKPNAMVTMSRVPPNQSIDTHRRQAAPYTSETLPRKTYDNAGTGMTGPPRQSTGLWPSSRQKSLESVCNESTVATASELASNHGYTSLDPTTGVYAKTYARHYGYNSGNRHLLCKTPNVTSSFV